MLIRLFAVVICCLLMGVHQVAIAGQVRLTGGQGIPSVIEVLEDSAFVVNSGASFWGYDLQFTVPNAVTQTPGPGSVWYLTGAPAVSVYKALSGTTELLGTNLFGNATYVLNSLEVRQFGSDLQFTANFPNYNEYNFQENDVITLISGSYQLGTATNGIWISPGSTYSITANSISTASENSPNYSSSFVTAVPEPATCVIAIASLACGGYRTFRRRRPR
jgi:hypothetical protein